LSAITTEGSGGKTASPVTTQDSTQIYLKDWGEGQPDDFSHGWPLDALELTHVGYCLSL
jgi:hypothetical protein